MAKQKLHVGGESIDYDTKDWGKVKRILSLHKDLRDESLYGMYKQSQINITALSEYSGEKFNILEGGVLKVTKYKKFKYGCSAHDNQHPDSDGCDDCPDCEDDSDNHITGIKLEAIHGDHVEVTMAVPEICFVSPTEDGSGISHAGVGGDNLVLWAGERKHISLK